jgi:hypothetical protein
LTRKWRDNVDEAWTCPSCKAALATPYCSSCGEKQVEPRDFSFAGIAHLTFQALSPVDGKVVRSFRDLLLRPGLLTDAFYRGLRKPYLGPFQIFILANVLFFFLQSFSEFQVFTTSLDARLDHQIEKDLGAAALVSERLAATGRTYEQYAPVFNQASAINAKSLIGIMVLPLALPLPLLFRKSARPLGHHVVFALHFYAFLLLVLGLPLVAMIAEKMLGGDGLMTQWVDNATAISLVIATLIYLFAAIGPAYGARGVMRGVQASVLTFVVVGIFLAYRIALLPITLYTT